MGLLDRAMAFFSGKATNETSRAGDPPWILDADKFSNSKELSDYMRENRPWKNLDTSQFSDEEKRSARQSVRAELSQDLESTGKLGVGKDTVRDMNNKALYKARVEGQAARDAARSSASARAVGAQRTSGADRSVERQR